MRSMFSKMFLVPAFAAAVVSMGLSAQAETVTVPFKFSALGMSFPAGVYRVDQIWGGGMVRLQALDGSRSFTSLVGPGEPSPDDQSVVLRFDPSSSAPTLRSIQYHGKITARLDKKTNKGTPLQISSGE